MSAKPTQLFLPLHPTSCRTFYISSLRSQLLKSDSISFLPWDLWSVVLEYYQHAARYALQELRRGTKDESIVQYHLLRTLLMFRSSTSSFVMDEELEVDGNDSEGRKFLSVITDNLQLQQLCTYEVARGAMEEVKDYVDEDEFSNFDHRIETLEQRWRDVLTYRILTLLVMDSYTRPLILSLSIEQLQQLWVPKTNFGWPIESQLIWSAFWSCIRDNQFVLLTRLLHAKPAYQTPNVFGPFEEVSSIQLYRAWFTEDREEIWRYLSDYFFSFTSAICSEIQASYPRTTNSTSCLNAHG